MRKGFVVVLLLALLLSVVPAMAQDEPGTIADIVVASASGETPEFSVLLAAVSAADPSILEALSDPEAGYTVFAPTDAAFAAAFEALGVTAEDVLADTDLLNTVLLYHVVPAELDAASVVAVDGGIIGTMLPSTFLTVAVDGESVMVNDATVVAADVAASNGIIHVIDSVLLPPAAEEGEAMAEGEMAAEEPVSIAETVVAAASADAPEFTVLLAAVSAADPSVLEALTNGGPFTVFAPTDAAFAAALEALGVTAEELLADTDLLTAVLAYHVVPGTFMAADVVGGLEAMEGELTVATLLPGAVLTVSMDGESVMVNEATIVATDVKASNGVIHVIDGVLLPPSGE